MKSNDDVRKYLHFENIWIVLLEVLQRNFDAWEYGNVYTAVDYTILYVYFESFLNNSWKYRNLNVYGNMYIILYYIMLYCTILHCLYTIRRCM